MNPEIELIDTHAHLYAAEFDTDREEMLQRAIKQGVKQVYLPNIESASITGMLKMESDYPGICFPMMGLHPCSVKEDYLHQLEVIESWLSKRTFAAVGEIGTDLYWDKTFIEQQVECLERQITWAIDLHLPVVLHSRDSLDLNIEIVSRLQKGGLRGVFHCFTGTVEQAKQIIDLGFYLGVGGVVTFKNSGLAEVLSALPMESLVLETDAPYLSPHPYRGKRNETAFIQLVAEKIASVLNQPYEVVCKMTTENALRLFQGAS